MDGGDCLKRKMKWERMDCGGGGSSRGRDSLKEKLNEMSDS